MSTERVIIGNAIILIASIIMVASGYLKSKERTLYWQTIQIGLSAVSCFVLGAISGGIVNLLAIPRNILGYKDKLTSSAKVVLLMVTSTLSIYFNVNGVIGYLPLVVSVSYILLMDKLKDDKFKMLIIATMVLWAIHDFYMKSYVSVVFNIGNIVTSSIAIYRIKNDEKSV